MNYSVEIQNEIEKLAYLLTIPEDISRIIEVNPCEFKDHLKDINSEVYRAFYKGLYRREMEIRKSNQKHADVETSEFDNQQLKDFKSHLIISLESY